MEGTEFGSYRLIAALGDSGQVWRAHDTANSRDVALRLLPQAASADGRLSRRFNHEVRIASELSDPHVVPVYAFGEIDGRLFVASRFVDGTSLQALLSGRPLDAGRAVDIVEQVAAALDAAHGRGLVHHGVEPSAVLLDHQGSALLGDFGIAAGAAGSPYSAPEQLRAGAGDDRSDVYSLTCVLYECLTGATPFPADERPAAPPRPSEDNPVVDQAFDAVIARGMAQQPAERYASAGALARAARAALTSSPEPTESASTTTPTAPPKPVRRRGIRGWSRRKLLVAGLASVGILAMVGTTAATLVMPFLLRNEEAASPRTVAPLPTSTAPTRYIAPLAVRPVGRALVPQGEQCAPGPPPPPAPPAEPATTCDVERKAFYERGPVGVELTRTDANAIKLPMTPFYAVQLVMDSASGARFGQYTGTQIGKQVAFIRDGVVLAAPAIGAPINGQSLQLSGDMTKETADTIARMLLEGR